MANGSHGHWAVVAAQRKKWQKLVGQCLMGRVPRSPFDRIKVTFTRCSSSEPDYDGLVHGFKPIRDALVLFGVATDDKNKNMEAVYQWELAPRGRGKVRVEIEELPPHTGKGADEARSGAV